MPSLRTAAKKEQRRPAAKATVAAAPPPSSPLDNASMWPDLGTDPALAALERKADQERQSEARIDEAASRGSAPAFAATTRASETAVSPPKPPAASPVLPTERRAFDDFPPPSSASIPLPKPKP